MAYADKKTNIYHVNVALYTAVCQYLLMHVVTIVNLYNHLQSSQFSRVMNPAPLTQMSAFVVMTFPPYRLTISGARYDRVVYLVLREDQ